MNIDPSQLDSPPLTHTDDYLDWTPAEHHDDCSEKGWQVRTYQTEPELTDKPYSIGMRAYCPSCGVSYELTARAGFRDEHGDAHGPYIHQEQVPYCGYQTQPKKVLGYWLHASGRRLGRLCEDKNADCFNRYYLTASKQAPRQHADVLGTVGWSLGKRSAVRWHGALVKPHQCGRYTTLVALSRSEKFTSPTAAARWLVRTLADQSSANPSS